MKVASLFAGIGGFDLGLERSGMECVAQVEWDKHCQSILSRHWPDVPKFSDVSEVEGKDLGSPDLICGGWPCQDISVAGRRAGLAGKRSGLFHEFMRLVAETTPRWVLAENVPGLLSSNNGRDMGTVLTTLGELGYGFAYHVLDAQYFGVAQRRRRVFIVGCLGDAGRAAEVLLEPESCGGDPAPSREKGKETPSTLGQSVAGTLGSHDSFRNDLDSNGAYVGVMTMRWREGKPGGGKGALLSEDKSLTPATSNDQTVFSTVTTTYGKQNYRGDGSDNLMRQGMEVRRLTPSECARLQGFPDDWNEGLPDSQRYKQFGNAVCVPVAEWIGKRIMEAA